MYADWHFYLSLGSRIVWRKGGIAFLIPFCLLSKSPGKYSACWHGCIRDAFYVYFCILFQAIHSFVRMAKLYSVQYSHRDRTSSKTIDVPPANFLRRDRANRIVATEEP